MFTAFEFAHRTYKETNNLLNVMRKVNMQRVIALYTADIERVNELDELIGSLEQEHEEAWDEQEKLSRTLWREVFADFTLRWKDSPEIIEKAWGIVLPRT